MRTQILVGLALGLVSAVVFASATTGPLLVRYVLFLITSLPIFLAGLGWGWLTAAVAAAASTLIIALLAGPWAALMFGVTQTVPAVILSYLALLNRPVSAEGPKPAGVEWYPPGRLVLWSAVMAGGLTLGVMTMAAGNLDTFNTGLREFIGKAVKDSVPQFEGQVPLSDVKIAQITDIAVAIMPAAAAVSWMSALLLNLWLAGRITLASGQLQRTWPDLSAMELPRGTSLMFLAGLLASGATGIAGAAGTGFAGAFFLAFVLMGLAVVHFLTRGKPWRPFVLWTLYAALLLFNVWIAVLVALLGLADGGFQLRQRAFPNGPPPPAGPVTPTPKS